MYGSKRSVDTMTLSCRWLDFVTPRHSAKTRLFCFPFAGADASMFRGWAQTFPPSIEVLPVQLPGRGKRFREPPVRRLALLREQLYEGLAPLFDRPIGFFGHSMGALIAFELARYVQTIEKHELSCIVVSGCKPPQLRSDSAKANAKLISQLPEEEFIAELARINGTPRELLQDKAALGVFLPSIRADFELLETAEYENNAKVACPLFAICGTNDTQATPEAMLLWRSFTSHSFDFSVVPGDHFFPVRCQKPFLRLLAAKIVGATDRDSGGLAP